MGLDTMTYWLTDHQSQCDFDFDFDFDFWLLSSEFLVEDSHGKFVEDKMTS
jgi:hypothetical protein